MGCFREVPQVAKAFRETYKEMDRFFPIFRASKTVTASLYRVIYICHVTNARRARVL